MYIYVYTYIYRYINIYMYVHLSHTHAQAADGGDEAAATSETAAGPETPGRMAEALSRGAVCQAMVSKRGADAEQSDWRSGQEADGISPLLQAGQRAGLDQDEKRVEGLQEQQGGQEKAEQDGMGRGSETGGGRSSCAPLSGETERGKGEELRDRCDGMDAQGAGIEREECPEVSDRLDDKGGSWPSVATVCLKRKARDEKTVRNGDGYVRLKYSNVRR